MARRPAPRRHKKSAPRTQGRARPPATTAKRKVRAPSPDDLLAAAFEMSQTQGIAQALRAIEGILKEHPNHWATIKYRYFLLWSVGHFQIALASANEALTRAADSIETLEDLAAYFLDVALRKAKENDAFVPHINPAIALVGHLAGHPKMKGRFQLALQYSLGVMRRHAEALEVGQKGLALYPKHEKSFHYNNSFDLFQLGRHEEAIVSFGHQLKPFTSKTDQTRPPDRYKELAANYDDVPLHQHYPKLMAQLIVRTVGATVAKRILDAGCGTGSLGTQIRTAHLVGIDRSPEMLAKARARNVYHELVENDLLAEMARRTDQFDIIASTVVLYHIGDLAPYFREAARLLMPGGYLFCSTDPAPDTIEIGVSGPGEYAHSRTYVRRLAAENGFAEIAVKLLPHRGNPGFWWALRRT